MIFFRGQKKGLMHLMTLLSQYGEASGQWISLEKCRSDFFRAFSLEIGSSLRDILGIGKGSLPFHYLGVPIFQGRPQASYLMPVVDKIAAKLTSWKGLLLSYIGRIQLVKATIQGILLHSFFIYAWPQPSLKLLDSYTRNFILWTVDMLKKKLVQVSWAKLCTPIASRELRVRPLQDINKAAMLRLGWLLVTSDGAWASLARAQVYVWIKFHIWLSKVLYVAWDSPTVRQSHGEFRLASWEWFSNIVLVRQMVDNYHIGIS